MNMSLSINNENSSAIQQHHIEANKLAVKLRNGCKSYGSVSVIKNLNLSVPEGSIYGLLGASGSGKTTILRCVVGRISLNSGTITVLGKEPCSKHHNVPGPWIGYMPQEIALYNEFNVSEILYYFGCLHNMKSDYIDARRNFLVKFLDMPDRTRLIKNLSGGQKRRASMAIALLQEPKLLILDEPTVGVDPLLREKIWDHLVDISKTSKTTIIITTHYIEEARKADFVGFLRDGHILAENPPEHLLSSYNETNLENVFLKLCTLDQSKLENGKSQNEIISDSSSNQLLNLSDEENIDKKPKNRLVRAKDTILKSFRWPKFHNYVGLLYKDAILIRRNWGFLFFQFLIPVIQMSLFCLCIGREPFNLNFGVVNNETLYNSSGNASNIYVNQLPTKTFNKKYLNWSEAYTMTKEGKLWGFIDIAANFTDETKNKLGNPLVNQSFPGSNINVYMDDSNQQISLIVQARVTQAYQSFLQIFLAIPGILPFPINPTLFDSPVVFQNPIYGQNNPQFIDFMAPGINITIIFTLTIGLTALMFVVEKKEGLLDRSWVAGVSTLEVMLAHVTAKLFIMSIQITLLILITDIAFEVTTKGPIILAALLLLLQGFCGMSYGLAISAGSSDETTVMQIAIGSVFPALLLSGIIWPLEGMPPSVRFIANFSPLTHAAQAMRCIASRGWGLTYFPVWFGFLTVILWSFVFNLVALIVFNFTQ